MKKIWLPKNEVANPSLQKRFQKAVLYNQRTYVRLHVFAVHSCFMCTYMSDCKFGAIFLLATRPPVASCSLSCCISTLKNPTAILHGLPPGPAPADETWYRNCWHCLGLWLQPSSSLGLAWPGRWDAESSITVGKHEDTPGVGFGEGGGCWFLSFCGFFFFLFWIGRFRCVVLLLLLYFRCWDELYRSQVPTLPCLWQTTEYRGPRCPRLRLQSSANGDVEGMTCMHCDRSTLWTCSVEACGMGVDVQQ